MGLCSERLRKMSREYREQGTGNREQERRVTRKGDDALPALNGSGSAPDRNKHRGNRSPRKPSTMGKVVRTSGRMRPPGKDMHPEINGKQNPRRLQTQISARDAAPRP